MKIIAVNGSPRRKGNTATLLEYALEGAASAGAKTRLVHLSRLRFTGCVSCFACKRRGGKSYGRCKIKDDLADLLARIEKADALIVGSPIYFGTTTGLTRSFFERLLFPYLAYTDPPSSVFPRKIATGLIYTMGTTEDQFRSVGLDRALSADRLLFELVFGTAESLYSFDTVQFKDYSKFVADSFDPERKVKHRQEVFPKDCQRAFEMGSLFVRGAGQAD